MLQQRRMCRVGEADSQSYPGAERVSVGGVVALALRALGPPEHLRVRLALCAAVQVTHNHITLYAVYYVYYSSIK